MHVTKLLGKRPSLNLQVGEMKKSLTEFSKMRLSASPVHENKLTVMLKTIWKPEARGEGGGVSIIFEKSQLNLLKPSDV